MNYHAKSAYQYDATTAPITVHCRTKSLARVEVDISAILDIANLIYTQALGSLSI